MVRFGAPLPGGRSQGLMAQLDERICASLADNDRFLEGEGAGQYGALVAPPRAARQDGPGARILSLLGGSGAERAP